MFITYSEPMPQEIVAALRSKNRRMKVDVLLRLYPGLYSSPLARFPNGEVELIPDALGFMFQIPLQRQMDA
jgi:hypothetical protein